MFQELQTNIKPSKKGSPNMLKASRFKFFHFFFYLFWMHCGNHEENENQSTQLKSLKHRQTIPFIWQSQKTLQTHLTPLSQPPRAVEIEILDEERHIIATQSIQAHFKLTVGLESEQKLFFFKPKKNLIEFSILTPHDNFEETLKFFQTILKTQSFKDQQNHQIAQSNLTHWIKEELTKADIRFLQHSYFPSLTSCNYNFENKLNEIDDRQQKVFLEIKKLNQQIEANSTQEDYKRQCQFHKDESKLRDLLLEEYDAKRELDFLVSLESLDPEDFSLQEKENKANLEKKLLTLQNDIEDLQKQIEEFKKQLSDPTKQLNHSYQEKKQALEYKESQIRQEKNHLQNQQKHWDQTLRLNLPFLFFQTSEHSNYSKEEIYCATEQYRREHVKRLEKDLVQLKNLDQQSSSITKRASTPEFETLLLNVHALEAKAAQTQELNEILLYFKTIISALPNELFNL
jgi:hypothetical protein